MPSLLAATDRCDLQLLHDCTHILLCATLKIDNEPQQRQQQQKAEPQAATEWAAPYWAGDV